MKVAVIGAGIAGLAAAHRILRDGIGVEVRVFEAADRVGGKIHTEHVDGFIVEGGADTFLARKPQGLALAVELGLGPRIRETKAETRGSYVVQDGALHEMPDGMSGLVPGRPELLKTTSLLSQEAKRRAAAEADLPPGGREGETVAEFVARRFGRAVYDAIVEPLLCGIYAGDGERLDVRAVAPKLVDLERTYGSITRGVAHTADVSEGGPTGFVSFDDGMSVLVNGLKEAIGDRVLFGRHVDRLEHDDRGWTVGAGDPFDAVVLCLPASGAADLTRAADPSLSTLLSSIRTVSTAVVTLGYHVSDIPRVLDRYGYVVPRREGGVVLASSWSSSKLSGRAPDEHVLIRVFLGRDGYSIEDLANEDLVGLARAEVSQRLSVTEDPVLQRVTRYDSSMPQYDVGHVSRVQEIRSRLRALGSVYVAGCAYDGVGIPDCIQSGWNAAKAVLSHSPSRAVRSDG